MLMIPAPDLDLRTFLTTASGCPIISRQPTKDQMPVETEDFLSRCVVDTLARKFYLYSSNGAEKLVECETVDQFMNVLEVVRSQVSEDCLAYTNPL